MTAVLDFAMLPPEVNSARMYSGAGSASMLGAASAWKGVAAELRSTALSYGAVLSALTDEEWQGPASAAMADAAAPYVAWMNTTAVQAEQAASQAEAAAAAYETAFAATVPPPEIAANRAQRVSLVSTFQTDDHFVATDPGLPSTVVIGLVPSNLTARPASLWVRKVPVAANQDFRPAAMKTVIISM